MPDVPTPSYAGEPPIARYRVDLDLMQEEFDLLAEVCDDPHDQDTDYGRGWRDALITARERVDAARPGQLRAVEILDEMISAVSE